MKEITNYQPCNLQAGMLEQWAGKAGCGHCWSTIDLACCKGHPMGEWIHVLLAGEILWGVISAWHEICSQEQLAVNDRTPTDDPEHIPSLWLHTIPGKMSILSVYVPILCLSQEIKDLFYEDLDSTIGRILGSEHSFLLGNLQPGLTQTTTPGQTVSGIWPHQDEWKWLDLCSYHKFFITNMFFSTKLCHWMVELDFIITRRAALKSVLLTCRLHSADCYTDHSMIIINDCMQSKKVHLTKQPRWPCISSAKTAHPELSMQFFDSIEWT